MTGNRNERKSCKLTVQCELWTSSSFWYLTLKFVVFCWLYIIKSTIVVRMKITKNCPRSDYLKVSKSRSLFNSSKRWTKLTILNIFSTQDKWVSFVFWKNWWPHNLISRLSDLYQNILPWGKWAKIWPLITKRTQCLLCIIISISNDL